MIDNMAAFREYFPEQAKQTDSLSREAQGAGISVIVTAPASNALSNRERAYFRQKMALHCSDSLEYSSLFGHCRETARGNAGSGLFMDHRRILEFQAAIFGKSAKETDRSRELREYIEERNGAFEDRAAGIENSQPPHEGEECSELSL